MEGHHIGNLPHMCFWVAMHGPGLGTGLGWALELATTGHWRRTITTADDFWRKPELCSLPDIEPLRSTVTGATLFPTTSICSADSGIAAYPIRGLPATGAAGKTGGTAYAWIGYNGRLYLTLAFDCNFMFSSNPNWPGPKVSVALWNAANGLGRPQYVDVLYAAGFYTCYTLSIDLRNVCNPADGAVFNPSPNAGSTCQCNGGACPSPPTNLFNEGMPLYMDVRVSLGDYASQDGLCAPGSIGNYTLSSPSDGPAVNPLLLPNQAVPFVNIIFPAYPEPRSIQLKVLMLDLLKLPCNSTSSVQGARAKDCTYVSFIMKYSYKIAELSPGQTDPNCTLSSTKLVATLMFYSIERGAKSMVGVFNEAAIGEFVTMYGIPCNSIIYMSYDDGSGATSVPPSVNVTAGPNCQLNDPPTTGAKVIVVLETNTQALDFYNAYATPTRADTIVRVLSLPCNRSSVIFAAPGLAEPRVFDQRNVPALQCASRTTTASGRRLVLAAERAMRAFEEAEAAAAQGGRRELPEEVAFGDVPEEERAGVALPLVSLPILSHGANEADPRAAASAATAAAVSRALGEAGEENMVTVGGQAAAALVGEDGRRRTAVLQDELAGLMLVNLDDEEEDSSSSSSSQEDALNPGSGVSAARGRQQ
eukprot:XP_001698936.1 predicted protein [Chlamydomonas reinhardtii]